GSTTRPIPSLHPRNTTRGASCQPPRRVKQAGPGSHQTKPADQTSVQQLRCSQHPPQNGPMAGKANNSQKVELTSTKSSKRTNGVNTLTQSPVGNEFTESPHRPLSNHLGANSS